jgi:hypothetical protein
MLCEVGLERAVEGMTIVAWFLYKLCCTALSSAITKMLRDGIGERKKMTLESFGGGTNSECQETRNAQTWYTYPAIKPMAINAPPASS